MQSEENEGLDLMRLLDTLKKWWWIVAITTLVLTAVSIFINYYYLKNVYEASTTLYSGTLSKSSITSMLQELQVGANVIQDYREIVKSRLIVEETKRLLKEDAKNNPKLSAVASLPYESFSSKVNVSLLNDTHIMKITVSDSDPQVCMLVANKIAGVFTEKVKKITKIDNIQVIDEAVKPELPVKPNKKKNVINFIAIGFVAGLGIIFLIYSGLASGRG
jgi:capsular polysaccharide biosynthesis protein